MSSVAPSQPVAQPVTELTDLAAALEGHGFSLTAATLEPLPDKGLAHDHVRLMGTGLLAGIPKQSQHGLDDVASLKYQAACVQRASVGGHAPQLHSLVSRSRWLPRGALPVGLLDRQRANCRGSWRPSFALASIHVLPLPPPAQRAPLTDAAERLVALLADVKSQTICLTGPARRSSALRAVSWNDCGRRAGKPTGRRAA